jgi:membrane associated rhomboid family serine protease/Zn-finger nucleic acid-binding protein
VICPSCGASLVKQKARGMAIDVCSRCGGIWVDSGRLDDFLVREIINRPDLPDAPPELRKEVTKPRDVSEPGRKCPRCGRPMGKLNYAYDSNIIVDRCETCNGVWADAGEIEQMVVHRKGNPRLDALGVALVDHDREMLKLRGQAQYAGGLADTPSPTKHSATTDDSPFDSVPIRISLGTALGIAVLSVLVFVQGRYISQDPSAFLAQWGLVPARLFSWKGAASLVSSLFIHGNLFHLVVNVFFLWLFGSCVEASAGHTKLAAWYLVCGALGNLAEGLVGAPSAQPVIGAGAAVAGMMGTFLALHRAANVRVPFRDLTFDLPYFVFPLAWVLLQAACVWTFRVTGTDASVGFLGHILGFACGYLLARFSRKRSVTAGSALA